MKKAWYGLWGLFVTLWMTATYPLHGFLPNSLATPHKALQPVHPPEWDHSFSDGKTFLVLLVSYLFSRYLCLALFNKSFAFTILWVFIYVINMLRAIPKIWKG